MICQRKGCKTEATCAIAVNVPAKGHKIGKHEPITAVIGLEVCDIHLALAEAREFFTTGSPLERVFRVSATGRAEPDFKRAWISRVEFDSPEWKTLVENRKDNDDQPPAAD